MVYWVPTIALVVHVVEELPRFPAWATRHFGATSRAWYVYSHVLLLVAFAVVSAEAHADGPGSRWALVGLACQWILAVNALFHVVTTLWFREYSPGVVTGVLGVLPATVYMHSRAVPSGLFPSTQVAFAIGLGAVISAAAIASLWLRADFDWTLQKPGVSPPAA
jgi:hypothetical protein